MASAAVDVLSSVGLGFLSAHHKKAVATENNVLGANVPATEEAFKKIMDQFSAGVIDAGTAITKLQRAVDAFKSATSSIRKQSGRAGETGDPKAGGKCNAACVWFFKLQEEADGLKEQIKAGTGGNIAATGTTPGVSVGSRSVGTKASGRSDDSTVATQQFSILSGLTGQNLALALGGFFVFMLLIFFASASRRERG